MFKQAAKFLRPGLYIFSVAFIFGVLVVLYEPLGLPSNKEVITWLTDLFRRYGVIIVFLASFIESIFMLSMYLPGSIVMVLSIAVLGDTVTNLFLIGFLSLCGYTLANFINYYLGRLGYYRILLAIGGRDQLRSMKSRISRRINLTIGLSAFHPNFLAISVVASGIVRYSFTSVIIKSILASTAWISLEIYILNAVLHNVNLEEADSGTAGIFLFLLIIWGLGVCTYEYFNHRNGPSDLR